MFGISLLVSCGEADEVTLIALTETRPGVLEIATSCAEDVSVRVEETSEEVRISDVAGSAIDGDCAGSVVVDLEARLNERAVVVEGVAWTNLAATCPLGAIGPADLHERTPSC